MNNKRGNLNRIGAAIAKHRQSPAARAAILVLAGTVTVTACGWFLTTDRSVRFNAYRTGRAFYTLPPLPIMYDHTGKELSVREESNFSDRQQETEESDIGGSKLNPTHLWTQTREAISRNDLNEARSLLTKFLELTSQPWSYEEEGGQMERNSARDMLDAIEALQKGSRAAAIKDYLDARYAYDGGTTEEIIIPASADKNLLDNWHYLQAAVSYKAGQKEKALDDFLDHASRYPRSEKNEAALYMAAKLRMESSYSFGNEQCGIETETDTIYGQPSEKLAEEPREKCQDENRQAAINAFRDLMKKYPNGKYFNDSRGWLAYLYRRGDERAKALAEYYRLLGHPTDINVRLEAKKSLQILGHQYDDATLDDVEQLIADDVDAAMAYAYHRIYNHAVDLTYQEFHSYCCYGDERWQQERDEKKRVADAHSSGKNELGRIARFATAMMKRHPQARITGGFVLRVAEAELELENYKDALLLSRKALSLGVAGDLRAQALWIKGSSEHAGKDLAAARATFGQLIAEFPKSKLTEGARRLLAMTAEDQHDLESALEQYLALDYEHDIAYFVDVLMPIERLVKFVDSHGESPHRNMLLYSLGIRFMRDKRWNDARAVLRKVQTRHIPRSERQIEYEGSEIFAKEPDWDSPDESSIRTSWVMQDLKTLDTLEHLERSVETAQGDEAKAESMYQLASFQFGADDLLFYNPAVWQGFRYMLLGEIDSRDTFRRVNESQLLFDYSQTHEPTARSIPIYLEIVDRYPQTRAARDAYYSAAVAHERVGNLNPYWRSIYERGLFAGPRDVSYADVKSAYPNYQMPRGTDGWEPSTRTVNGGPGWAAPEKPKPRETREHKIKRLLKEFTEELSTITDKFSTKVQTKVDAGVTWYGSVIKAAVYGTLAGLGLWAIILVGIGLHSQRLRSQLMPEPDEPANADSRVDKMIG